ncbi:hypothetical protein [Natronocalculus amylovorans]|uniref:Uncharacterized protein n=1 Tax=Natronocalculus amylovorans TaxID=2917812 RepID=A0AAE3K7L0_9EURY|nr:hypothetical protein [Natronocalculus amylovorans]MCL9816342.1 hypothetical protein [Natronocalculus amylovorans]
MSSQSDDLYDRAVAMLANRHYEHAGDALARGGWLLLANPRFDNSPFDDDEKGWVGKGIERLVTSAICYRVAGRSDRAAHRGTEASAVAADFQTVCTRPVQQACLQEMRADAIVAAGLDGAAKLYRDAASAYQTAGASIDDPQYWSTTPLFGAAAAPLQQVARSTANGEVAVSWQALHGPDPGDPGQFLAHRATFKRQRFATLLETVVAEGYLAAPRGTTAYNSETYRCPSCQSKDVNWVGDSTLCMRCSTPLDRI